MLSLPVFKLLLLIYEVFVALLLYALKEHRGDCCAVKNLPFSKMNKIFSYETCLKSPVIAVKGLKERPPVQYL
jgi:hypothetical protein